MHPKDQEKTTFTTPWGIFMYAKMPFGLMNGGEELSREQWIFLFSKEKERFLVIYLDYIIVFFKYDEDHLKNLK